MAPASRFEEPSALVARLERELDGIWPPRQRSQIRLHRAASALWLSTAALGAEMTRFAGLIALAASTGVLSANLLELVCL